MKQNIQRIMCCCGNGVGTSLVMQMTIEEALENPDLFVVSEEVLPLPNSLPAIGLSDLMDAEPAAEQLKKYLEI